MASMTEVARGFFEACEEGKGWDGCREYCASDATFSRLLTSKWVRARDF